MIRNKNKVLITGVSGLLGSNLCGEKYSFKDFSS
jgi:nucleoside-diphosphate-sugar epimerase